ncbi:hypothetical protein UY3_13361 [Chelonia mydas]|uniref:Vipericidin n=1 Tax=Chelonia mydas TaxID=8469 RepID=M7AXN0_CHEMY|nr:hypothetical protein UY3_13361 [Chelonia mydas]
MVSCWAVLLLLLSVATAVPVQPPQPYEKAIARAIDFYNQGPTPSASLQPPLCLKCSPQTEYQNKGEEPGKIKQKHMKEVRKPEGFHNPSQATLHKGPEEAAHKRASPKATGLHSQLTLQGLGSRMESCWGVLMMLGVAVATTTSPPPQQQMLSYEEAVSLAIDLYNQEPHIDFAFRLLEAEAQPDWAATNETLQLLEFTVKETECPVSENLLLDECDFRSNGVVRACSGTISTEPEAPLVLLTCDTVAQEIYQLPAYPQLSHHRYSV